MFKAILFDLDDTLLRNEMTTFVQAYWETLLPKMTRVYPHLEIKDAILAATQAMMSAHRSASSLRDIFVTTFESITNLDFDDAEPVFIDYYRNEYRGIQRLTQPVVGASRALELAARITDNIVLATIPIFPLIAIEERVRWAGLHDFPFSLITSFELMHASKPNPQYYAEIAEQVSCAPEECLMVGNDCRDDMIAKAVGMKTFLVTDYAIQRRDGAFDPEYQGTLMDLLDFFITWL